MSPSASSWLPSFNAFHLAVLIVGALSVIYHIAESFREANGESGQGFKSSKPLRRLGIELLSDSFSVNSLQLGARYGRPKQRYKSRL